jgi:hypothetical protein
MLSGARVRRPWRSNALGVAESLQPVQHELMFIERVGREILTALAVGE